MIKIFLDEDEERLERLAFSGEELASETDYEIELKLYSAGRCSESILRILAPGQGIVLREGRFFLDEDLDLLVDDD